MEQKGREHVYSVLLLPVRFPIGREKLMYNRRVAGTIWIIEEGAKINSFLPLAGGFDAHRGELTAGDR
jgi:hypothetical protein